MWLKNINNLTYKKIKLMKLTLYRVLFIVIMVASVILVAMALITSSMPALVCGFVLLILCLMAISFKLYYHLITILYYVKRVQKKDTVLGQSIARVNDQIMQVNESIQVTKVSLDDAVQVIEGRFDETVQTVEGKLDHRIGKHDKRVINTIAKVNRQSVSEVEALFQLQRLFSFYTARPLLGGWALPPSSMLALTQEIRKRKPELIVELGSGTSTLWLACALAQNGRGYIISFEHQDEFAQSTRARVKEHGVEGLVEVRFAPLTKQTLGNETYSWYDPAQLTGIEGIDFLIVDGPPGKTGPLARYPALPLLSDRLAFRASIVLDDTNRVDEKQCLERWCKEIPGVGEPKVLASRTSIIEFDRP